MPETFEGVSKPPVLHLKEIVIQAEIFHKLTFIMVLRKRYSMSVVSSN